jgi:hypothetical protein
MDHEVGMSKTGVVPTVILRVGLTPNPQDSLYVGDVFVTLKDKVLEPSEACRAALEMKRTLMDDEDDGKHMFILHCDGGGEHNVSHPSVIFALIILFLTNRLKFDKVGVVLPLELKFCYVAPF